MSIIHETAVADCKYAKSLGRIALNQHFSHWSGPTSGYTLEEMYYRQYMDEIKQKLDTEECLLKEV